MKLFAVVVEVYVQAQSVREAEDEVEGLMSYAFEVSNDQGIFKQYHVAGEGGKTHEVGDGATPTRKTRGQTALDL